MDILGGVPPRPLTDDARYRDEELVWSADRSRYRLAGWDGAGAGSIRIKAPSFSAVSKYR